MCGRFTQQMTWRELHELYSLLTQLDSSEIQTHYNGAPTQNFAACRLDRTGERCGVLLRWGLIPSWAKDKTFGSRLINARAETVHSKPSFRQAFRSRRCLIPANGWFEWSTTGTRKQPYFISSAEGSLLSFAGLWETWQGEEELLETFSIITTEASPTLREIHHRQPAIISPQAFDEWLDPGSSAESLLNLVRHSHEGPFESVAVSTRVNNVRNNSGDIFEPLAGEDIPNSRQTD